MTPIEPLNTDPLLLARIPQLAQIDDSAGLAILAQAQAQAVELPPQTTIFRQGDQCSNYLIVVEGSIRVLGRSSSGREILLYRIDGFGTCVLTTSCLLGDQHYPAEGITETAVKAFALSKTQFQQALERSAGLRAFIFDTYGQRLNSLITLVQEIAFERVDLRLAKQLFALSDEQDRLQITHQALATELGSAREVISRQLKELEHRGWLQLQRGAILMTDRRALQQFIDSHDL
jgi:CRP/FNR family transcriptional regulator